MLELNTEEAHPRRLPLERPEADEVDRDGDEAAEREDRGEPAGQLLVGEQLHGAREHRREEREPGRDDAGVGGQRDAATDEPDVIGRLGARPAAEEPCGARDR